MLKKNKPLSFNERLYGSCSVPLAKCDHRTVRTLTTVNELDTVTGRMRKKSKYTRIDNDSRDTLSIADFSLDNLLAVGAELKPCSLSRSTMECIDNADMQAMNITNSINVTTEPKTE